MGRCKATIKDGSRCKNATSDGESYCRIHKNKDNSAIPALAIGGAIIGNILFPGVGGALVGGIIGGLIGANSNKDKGNG